MGTTFIDTIDPVKVELQKAVLKSWSFFDPSIKLVLFTDSEYWKERAREVGITWTEAFALNPNGLPYFSSMTEYLQDHYVSRFYGYVNGDIIFHSTLRDVLLRIDHAIPSPHLLVVGRRYNAYFKSGTLSSLSSASAVDRYIKSQIRFSEQFIPVAQDYFLFTENTFTRHNLLPVVVGRNRYDNYLLTLCKTTSTCRLADASEALIALHLSDASGDFAGTKARVDADWNARLIGDNHHFNSVAFSDWRVLRLQSGEVVLARNAFVDDAFAPAAVAFLRKFVTAESRFVYYGRTAVGAALLTEFGTIPVAAVMSDKWFNNNMELVMAKPSREGVYQEVRLPSVWEIDKTGTCARYANYLSFYAGLIDENAERRKRKCPACPPFSKKNNVIVVDGDCRFHLLRQLASVVSFSSVVVVPDLLLQKYEGFEVVEEALELVDVYTPSMEGADVRSLHVFRRSHEKTWSIHAFQSFQG
ncbi:hypothetical protein WA556_005472 [Blastocystis sp. ATCC 50177/Nand II]